MGDGLCVPGAPRGGGNPRRVAAAYCNHIAASTAFAVRSIMWGTSSVGLPEMSRLLYDCLQSISDVDGEED